MPKTAKTEEQSRIFSPEARAILQTVFDGHPPSYDLGVEQAMTRLNELKPRIRKSVTEEFTRMGVRAAIHDLYRTHRNSVARMTVSSAPARAPIHKAPRKRTSALAQVYAGLYGISFDIGGQLKYLGEMNRGDLIGLAVIYESEAAGKLSTAKWFRLLARELPDAQTSVLRGVDAEKLKKLRDRALAS